VIGRILVISLALPVAFFTGAVRGGIEGWMYWKRFDWYTESGLHKEMDLLLVLSLSVGSFFIACWLVEWLKRCVHRKTPHPIPPLPRE